MKVIQTTSLPDDTLAEGEEVITKIINPQIFKDGVMIQAAQIEVTVGTKKGGLSREQWLEEQKKKQSKADKINDRYNAKISDLKAQQEGKTKTEETVTPLEGFEEFFNIFAESSDVDEAIQKLIDNKTITKVCK